MTTEFTISPDGIARLHLLGTSNHAEVAAAAAAALDQVDRVEAEVPVADRAARRALHRAGFRLEGVRRKAHRGPDGAMTDAGSYARLRDDATDGMLGFTSVMNSVLPRTRVIAHVLFHRPAESGGREYLFCQTVFKDDWELPGGVVERGESPRAGAVREVAEELGLAVSLGGLLAVDWLPSHLGWDDAVEMIFDGGELTRAEVDQMVLQASEIAEVHWRRADAAYPRLRPAAARRLQLIVDGPDRTHYLEDGAR